MPRSPESWSTQQLAEFLEIVSAFTTESDAIRGGVERAAEALDAEVAALVENNEVLASIGFPGGAAPAEPLVAAARKRSAELDLPVVGQCSAISAPLGTDGRRVLVAARADTDGFTQEEADLLRGMGRVLALALRVQERQVLLEKLSVLQRSIARRAALHEVFDTIVDGAHDLLGDETVGLRLVAADDPSEFELVASRGVNRSRLAAMRRGPIGMGAGGRAINEGRLVVVYDYESEPEMVPQMVSAGIRAALAAPIYQRGEAVGSLVVATHRPGRVYSASEHEALTAFAEHAGLALNDAKAAEETAHQAFHDPLTGLPNRALFLDRLRVALRRARFGAHEVGVLFADLDGFKVVNDSLGHANGDRLLISVGRRLEGGTRPAETIARFGGDEFAVLLEEVHDPIDAARAARRLLEVLEPLFQVGGREVSVSASIGIAVGREEPEEMLRNADLAMYEAKGQGKGRYEIYEREMYRAMSDRLELEQDLKRAIDREEFVLYYQPLVALEDGRITGVEALIRWMHPDRGLIAPGEFIPLAEESGQIQEIGRWVLHRACHRVADWARRFGPLELSVNLSGAQLRQASLVREVSDALSETGFNPGSLICEMTETVVADASASNVERLGALKRLGVQLAVDDFGTGYSSLQYLRRFPIDWLKIAKPFVDGVGRSDEESGIARAIVDLAHSLGLEVVAEGIESRRQSQRLLDFGCTRGQGFHYSPPLPAEEVDAVLAGVPALGGTISPGASR